MKTNNNVISTEGKKSIVIYYVVRKACQRIDTLLRRYDIGSPKPSPANGRRLMARGKGSLFPLGGSITTPLIRRMVFGDSGSFDFTTITLVKCPVLLVLYFTLISPWPFGEIGSLGHSGTTHPHDEKAELMTSGTVPWLLKWNTCVPSPFWAMVSKLKTVSSNTIFGLATSCALA